MESIRKSMEWFLYDNGLRHERVNRMCRFSSKSHVGISGNSYIDTSSIIIFDILMKQFMRLQIASVL